MLSIVDYGVGNLFSLKSSLEAIGETPLVTGDPQQLRESSRIILPGVGAFADAAEKLCALGLDTVLKEKAAAGTPILGICLGMQLLFDKSFEYGEHEGLGLISGAVIPMEGLIPAELKIPHIGWNALHLGADKHPLFAQVEENDCVYFVHSYFASHCDGAVIATTEYGKELTAAVAQGSVMGCQFHPEKSGTVGLNILRAFCRMGEKL